MAAAERWLPRSVTECEKWIRMAPRPSVVTVPWHFGSSSPITYSQSPDSFSWMPSLYISARCLPPTNVASKWTCFPRYESNSYPLCFRHCHQNADADTNDDFEQEWGLRSVTPYSRCHSSSLRSGETFADLSASSIDQPVFNHIRR